MIGFFVAFKIYLTYANYINMTYYVLDKQN